LPEIGLALGYEQGEHIAWVREWLYWYDRSGNRYLTAEERARAAAAMAEQASLIAEQERLNAQQERLAKQEAEQKAQRLAERLRALGINPDEV
jgi:non-ribosomal peptide synthetase component E (peptide arylation enzyme)